MTRATCHPTEPRYALGLCRRCYNRGSRKRSTRRAGELADALEEVLSTGPGAEVEDVLKRYRVWREASR